MKITAIAIIYFFLSASAGSGQALSKKSSLTWEDCIAAAKRNNPDLASSRQAQESTQASYYGSFNSLMPRITLSNSYNKSGNGSESAYWQAQGNISWDIFNTFQIANVRASAASLVQANANLQVTASVLRLNLRRAFAQLLFAQKNVEVSQSIKEMREQSAQLVTLRYDSGRESKGNMLRAQAQLLQAKADLAQSLRELRSSQQSLNRQLGQDDFSVVFATGTLRTQALPDLPADSRSFLGVRPDIQAQEAVVKVLEARLQQSKSSLWPNLSANYTRSVTGSTEFPSSSYAWSFSGILSYPLFGSGPTAAYFDISAAKKNLEKTKQDLRALREQAIVEIETAWSGFAGAVDQIQVQFALLEAARQRNDEADIRYASGLLTYDNWEIITSDRVNQERQYIQAQLNAVISEAAWEKALGKPLEE